MNYLTELITYLLFSWVTNQLQRLGFKMCVSHTTTWFKEVSRLFFSYRGEENGYIVSSSIISYLSCQDKSFAPIVAVRWEMCQVVTCTSHGWGELEFLVLCFSLLALPINCQLFWERILFPPSFSEEALGELGAPSGCDGWMACRVVVSNAECLNWDTPSLLDVLIQRIHVSHDLL